MNSTEAPYDITIADGVTVTLDDASITKHKSGSYCNAGLTCSGNVTLILEGESTITVACEETSSIQDQTTQPAIRVPFGSSLTITGTGTLVASNAYYSCATAIGEKPYVVSGGGSISILGGTVIAYGGSGAAAIGASDVTDSNEYTSLVIGPDVVKVVAVCKPTRYVNNGVYVYRDHSYLIGPESARRPDGQGGAFSIDSSLTNLDTEVEIPFYDDSMTCLVRTLVHSADIQTPEAVVASAYDAWAAGKNAQGAHLSGAWNAADANGVANVFRYAFDMADDADFTENDIILDFATDGNGLVAIQTLPVVNGKGLFSFTIVASDNADGTGNVAEYPLSLDEEGITYIDEEYNPSRFFRVRVDVGQ